MPPSCSCRKTPRPFSPTHPLPLRGTEAARPAPDEAGENSAMVDRAMELGDYLCQMREDVLVGYLCSLESAKLKRTRPGRLFRRRARVVRRRPFAAIRRKSAGNVRRNG